MRYQNSEENKKQSTTKVVTVDLGLENLVPNFGIPSEVVFMKFYCPPRFSPTRESKFSSQTSSGLGRELRRFFDIVVHDLHSDRKFPALGCLLKLIAVAVGIG